MEKGIKKYFGTKAFYASVMGIAIPMIIQNVITNFVNMLDNIMVGQIGTAQMSGVSIVNQLLFVFNLCIFGATAGAGIFTAQYAGSKDWKNVRNTLRFKLISVVLISAVGICILSFFLEPLVGLYLKGEGTKEDAEMFLAYGKDYFKIIVIGLLPFALSNAYAGNLRETGNTVVPMAAGLTAVFVNLILNYVLIFGHLGAPAMGVRGAALATIISRFVELGIVAVWSHTHPDKVPYIKGLYKGFGIPPELCKKIILKGMPLLANETIWSIGVTILNQSYSYRSLDVVSAINISSTIWGVFSVFFLTMGNVVGIYMGHHLGAGDSREDILDLNKKLTAFAVAVCLVFALVLGLLSGIFPRIYNTTESVRSLARAFIIVGAVMMPFNSFTNACYFTLRSGGKTVITFIFDSGFVWCLCVPLAWFLSRKTALPIIPLYAIINALDIIKCILGSIMVKRGSWIQNLSVAK
ncbi:MAG: MATE family efflux transporter [Oscillospiraceae bacterium]|nr:MATE family efflux transporter [Oscillospiraceae bacterium]